MRHALTAGAWVALAAGIAGCAGGADTTAIAMVNRTCAQIEKDAEGTFRKIIEGRPPYVAETDPSRYVFVYDTDVKVVAHPNPRLVGRSLKGKPDAAGKMFRDEIVRGAQASGSGWVEYLYDKPGAEGAQPKRTYYRLIQAADGAKYVVCCGEYQD